MKFLCLNRIKKHWEIILRVKVAFLMFCVMSSETVQDPQNSHKTIIRKIKQMQSFLKQHLCATSLNMSH